MQQKIIRVGIAGFGLSARVFHLPFLLADKRFQIKKVFERSSNHSQSYLDNVQTVRQFSELLSQEIDLVVITTPNQTHFELAKQAILAGKNVLVEKPLAATAEQARELVALAKQQNVLLSIYQNRRWDNAITTAKEILAQGLIGEPVSCAIRFERYAKSKNSKQWKETGELGTGLVYDLGVHLLDQAVHLFGKPSAIYADIRYQHDEALSDDHFTLLLDFPSGLQAVLSATKFAREPSPHFSLHGKLGSYVKQSVDPQEALLNQGVKPVGDWNQEPESEWGILHTEQAGEVVRKPYSNPPSSYQAFYDNLYLALTENQPLIVQPEQVMLVLELIEKAYQSAKLGQKLPA